MYNIHCISQAKPIYIFHIKKCAKLGRITKEKDMFTQPCDLNSRLPVLRQTWMYFNKKTLLHNVNNSLAGTGSKTLVENIMIS